MGPANRKPQISRRQAMAALAFGVVAPNALAACAGGSGNKSGTSGPPPKPAITFSPDNAATKVIPTVPVGLQVSNGWLQQVTLANQQGKAVAGALNRDRTAFTTTEPLGYGTVYTWSGSVVGRDGQAVPVKASFTTVDPPPR